jgi:hypothetical protein
MNVQDFTYLLQNPHEVVNASQTKELEAILTEYPYFQAARAIHLKGLKTLNSFKYNDALKVTAAYTTDRDILFDFITSEEFLQNSIADSITGKSSDKEKAETPQEKVVDDLAKKELIEKSDDAPLPQSIDDADHILDPNLFKSKDPKIDLEIAQAKKEAEKTLEIGTPLTFTKDEKHSFAEWLNLTTRKPIQREKASSEIEKGISKEEKFELIDRFIDENPKIIPSESSSKIDMKSSLKIDKNELMTETLAKVYLEQKKYIKAMQAYKILSLKYPEKSGFFADRIKAIEKIQQDNS